VASSTCIIITGYHIGRDIQNEAESIYSHSLGNSEITETFEQESEPFKNGISEATI
jgi:hypothetical protein